jgi:hypothetical protein
MQERWVDRVHERKPLCGLKRHVGREANERGATSRHRVSLAGIQATAVTASSCPRSVDTSSPAVFHTRAACVSHLKPPLPKSQNWILIVPPPRKRTRTQPACRVGFLAKYSLETRDDKTSMSNSARSRRTPSAIKLPGMGGGNSWQTSRRNEDTHWAR